jgi:plastocyanin
MKRLNAVLRLTFSLATMFAIVFLSQAESGNRRATATQQKRSANHEIHIMDQNGNPAVSGKPSGTGQIVDVTVAPGGTFTFDPSTVNISVGDTVRWTWAGNGHSVTSGPPCEADSQY